MCSAQNLKRCRLLPPFPWISFPNPKAPKSLLPHEAVPTFFMWLLSSPYCSLLKLSLLPPVPVSPFCGTFFPISCSLLSYLSVLFFLLYQSFLPPIALLHSCHTVLLSPSSCRTLSFLPNCMVLSSCNGSLVALSLLSFSVIIFLLLCLLLYFLGVPPSSCSILLPPVAFSFLL